jgi:YihY family inner membrane protein
MGENGTLLAAAVSYNFLFSLFPFILALVSIAGFFLEPAGLQRSVIRSLTEIMPLAEGIITQGVSGIIDARGAAGVLAIVMLLVSSASFFNAVRNALNTAWGVKHPAPFLKGQLMNILMMAATAVLLFLSMAINYVPGLIEDYTSRIAGAGPREVNLFLQWSTLALGIIIEFSVFLLVYRFVPSKRPPWRAVWWGALAVTAANELLKQVFLWYVRAFNPYNAIYGSIGAIIALLAWVYLSALIFLFVAKAMVLRLDHLRRNPELSSDPTRVEPARDARRG